MRKINALLAIVIMILFLVHGILGAFQLAGIGDTAAKAVARTAEILIYIHIVIGLKFTFDTVRAAQKNKNATGKSSTYFRENKLFWIRRISGLAVFLFMIPHLNSFSMTINVGAGADGMEDEYVRLAVFDGFRLAVNILLVIAVAVHVISNIRPAFISFGIKNSKDFYLDLLLVLAIILVLMAVAFIVYYLRWNYW